MLDARRSNALCVPLHGVRLFIFSRLRDESKLLENVEVESEMGRKLLNEFAISISTTDVRDCFHRFRILRRPWEVIFVQASLGTPCSQ